VDRVQAKYQAVLTSTKVHPSSRLAWCILCLIICWCSPPFTNTDNIPAIRGTKASTKLRFRQARLSTTLLVHLLIDATPPPPPMLLLLGQGDGKEYGGGWDEDVCIKTAVRRENAWNIHTPYKGQTYQRNLTQQLSKTRTDE